MSICLPARQPRRRHRLDWRAERHCCCPDEEPPVPTECCEEVPFNLTLTISAPTCPDVDGQVLTISNYDFVGFEGWKNAASAEATDGAVIIYCDHNSTHWNFSFQGTINGINVGSSLVSASTETCDPFLLEFSGTFSGAASPDCNGEAFTITVTP